MHYSVCDEIEFLLRAKQPKLCPPTPHFVSFFSILGQKTWEWKSWGQEGRGPGHGVVCKYIFLLYDYYILYLVLISVLCSSWTISIASPVRVGGRRKNYKFKVIVNFWFFICIVSAVNMICFLDNGHTTLLNIKKLFNKSLVFDIQKIYVLIRIIQFNFLLLCSVTLLICIHELSPVCKEVLWTKTSPTMEHQWNLIFRVNLLGST